jgi:hypothetical protein
LASAWCANTFDDITSETKEVAMDNQWVRTVLGVIVGVVCGGLVVFLVEGAGHAIFPPPPDTDLSDPKSLESLMANMPIGALVMVLLGWFLGSLAGAWMARLVARQNLSAWIVALLFIALTATNFLYIPHPVWMMAAGVLIPLVSAWLVSRRPLPTPAPAPHDDQ